MPEKLRTMKTISTLLLTLSILVAAGEAKAGTTYNINSNSNWSAVIPATCANCIINVASGATLTVDESVTCQSCTFSGGNITMAAYTMNLQSATGTYTVAFTGVNLSTTGGTITVNEPLSMTNSTFTLNGSSSMTTSFQDDLVNSKIKLFGSSTLQQTGAASVNINMSSGSVIQIGDGTTSSMASYIVNGPTLNIYDTSSVTAGANTNNFFDWNTYYTAVNAASAKTAHMSYNNSNANLNLNCGGVNPHACSNPNLYGPATLSASGTTAGAILLPVLLVDLTAVLNIDKMVVLNWETTMESNSSHFNIERSQDGSVWNTIGTVQAAGNSSRTIDYSFIDESPATGVNYYRLGMVDRDGRSAQSEVKIVRTTSLMNKVSFYPNPARDYVNVSLGQASAPNVTVRLISQSGQVLQEKKAVGGNGTTVTFPVQQYATGIYILSVAGADGSHESRALVISHS
jgi:Secretion system C-terminal sorting domain